MPPWIYQKHILPKNVPVHVSNLAPTPEMASNAQLLTENQALRQEIHTLDETLQDLHQEMHDRFDAGNIQILLLASFLEQFLQQNAEKEKKRKSGHWLHSGKAVIFTEDDILELIDRAEALRKAKADEVTPKKVCQSQQKKLVEDVAEVRRMRAEACEMAKLYNEALMASWWATKVEFDMCGEKPPPKPCVATCAEVWALLLDPDLPVEKDMDILDEQEGSEGSEGSSDEERGEDEFDSMLH